MRLTSDNVREICMYGGMGMFILSSFKLTEIWLQRRSRTEPLRPKTRFVVDDDELYELLLAWQRYAFVDPENFENVVSCADLLLLTTRDEIPDDEHINSRTVTGLVAKNKTLSCARHMLSSAKAQDLHEECVQLLSLYKDLDKVLGARYERAMLLS